MYLWKQITQRLKIQSDIIAEIKMIIYYCDNVYDIID